MNMLLIVFLLIVDFALVANVMLPRTKPMPLRPAIPAPEFAEIPETYQTVNTTTIWCSADRLEHWKATGRVLNSSIGHGGGYWLTVATHQQQVDA